MKRHRKPQKKSVPKVATAVKTQELTIDVRTTVESHALDYEMTNERIKILEDRKKFLRKDVEETVANFGIEDASGHKHLNLTGIEIVYEKRVSPGFNSVAAEEILKKRNLLDSVGQKVITERWEIDEEKIYQAYEAGLLTPKDVDQMFDVKVSWALKVKVDKDKNPEYKLLKELRKPQTGKQEDMPYVVSQEEG